jgi:hypothetical protein
MVRTNDKNKPLWRKTSTGTLYPFANRRSLRVKFKQEIRATKEELGKWIDQFELVENVSGKNKVNPEDLKEEVVKTPDKDVYSLIHVGVGWYNIESSAGKVMNEKKLRQVDAKALLEKLEQETPVE